jgi:hypothetical protein
MPRSSPAPPTPTRAMRSGGKERNAPRAPSQYFFFLHDADSPGCARADPQPSAAEPAPSQHAPEAAVPGATFERRQGPRAGELLVALPPASLGYKNPRRSPPEEAHTHRNRSPLSSLPLSLGNVRSLQGSTVAFWRIPATIGAATGARWRSRAAAVDLLPRRQALLPLHRAAAVEHSSLHAPVSFHPSGGRRCTRAVRS